MNFAEEIRAVDRSEGACRRFGWLVGGVLLAVGIGFLWKGRPGWGWSGMVAGGTLMILAGARPRWLKWIQWGWMILALALGRVISPIILALLYFGVFTPVGLLARLCGRDFLTRCPDPRMTTYWRPRPRAQGVGTGTRYERQG